MDNKKCKPTIFKMRVHPDQLQAWKVSAKEDKKTLSSYVKACISAKLIDGKK